MHPTFPKQKLHFQYLKSACQFANKETVELLINKFIQKGISVNMKDEDIFNAILGLVQAEILLTNGNNSKIDLKD